MKHWLIKSEPNSYSIDNLKKDKRTEWDGVRNYQARNFMRDDMRVGDGLLFYHSSCDVPGVYGVAKVTKEAHPDESAFDKNDSHFDPKSVKENPTWVNVDVSYVKKLMHPVTLFEIKNTKALEGIMVAMRGSRLSIQSVSKAHFDLIVKMGGK